MKVGEIITVHFAIPPVRGVVRMKVPPPGAWTQDGDYRELWGPVGESLDGGSHDNGLEVEVIHDTMHYTEGSQGLSIVAVHDHEAKNQGFGRLAWLADFRTDDLIDEVASRRNFAGLIIRDGEEAPEIKPGIRLKGDDATDLLRSALEELEGEDDAEEEERGGTDAATTAAGSDAARLWVEKWRLRVLARMRAINVSDDTLQELVSCDAHSALYAKGPVDIADAEAICKALNMD